MKSIINSTEEFTPENLPYHCALTHNGEVHCDDIFAAVIIDMFFRGDLTLFRVSSIPENLTSTNIIIFGIGLTEFDPNSETTPLRANGKKYSTAGLLWKRFGKNVLKKMGAPAKYADIMADKIYKDFIRDIDNLTVGEQYKEFRFKYFTDTNRDFATDEESNKAFNEMFDTAYNIFNQIIQKEIRIWKAKRPYKGANGGAH